MSNCLDEKEIVRILILFGDNDFHDVMLAFGNLMVSGNKWEESLLTKLNIVRWFNAVAPTLYEMVQANGRSDQHLPLDYLTIEDRRVYLGNEVNEKLDSYSHWGNGDGVLIDLDALPRPTVVTL